MSMLSKKVFRPLEKGQYEVTVSNYEHVVMSDNKEHIKFTLVFPDSRPVTYVGFPTNVDYIAQNMAKQTDLYDLDYSDLFKSVVGKKLTVWVSYNEYGMNIALHEAKTVTPTATIEEAPIF